MCGFAGAVTFDERYEVDDRALAAMSTAVAHRGPDGEATWRAPGVALAFRRLAVLDPCARSMQPFALGGVRLAFNGEVYNYRALRAELSALRPGHAWRTDGDVEVLALALDTWRERALPRLRGMFAFAAWFEGERALLLGRDAAGQKPLYLMPTGGALAFASDSRALRAVPWWRGEADDGAVLDYLRYGCVGAGASWWRGVRQLPPSTWAWFDTRGLREPTRYEPDVPRIELPGDDAGRAAVARELVERAVQSHLVSDVPLGVLLSGGVDSAVVALCAQQASAAKLKTFSVGLDDPRYDESAAAAETARHLGTEHVPLRVAPAPDDVPALARALPEPFADSSALPTLALCRAVRQHVTVALGGDGGDEVFGGYDRYRAMRLHARLRTLAPLSPLGRRLARGHPKARSTRAGRLLATSALPAARAYDALVRVFDDDALRALWPDAPQVEPRVAERFARERREPASAAAATDRACYLPDDLLVKLDRCSMAVGLEARPPLVAEELAAFAGLLSDHDLLAGGKKRLLRLAFARDLPAGLFGRPKRGFAVPIGDWLRGPLRPLVRDAVMADGAFGGRLGRAAVERLIGEHERGRADHSARVWALLVWALWERASV